MKILLLNGSPRKNGNTAAALKTLCTALGNAHDTEYADLYAYSVSPCLSCYQCKKNGGNCIQKDDTNTLLEKISSADCIVFGSPVYWWGISAQLKLVVDKFIARVDMFQQTPKKIITVAVGASGTEDPQYRLIREQFTCISQYLNWNYISSLSFSAWEAGELEKQPQLGETMQNLAKSLTA